MYMSKCQFIFIQSLEVDLIMCRDPLSTLLRITDESHLFFCWNSSNLLYGACAKSLSAPLDKGHYLEESLLPVH